VAVSVNPVGLPPGQYYGSVNIDAPNAANNPQTLLVLLNVEAAGNSAAGIEFSSGSVMFSGPAGNTTPQQQQISLFNPTNNTIGYSATISAANGIGWLSLPSVTGQLLPGSTSIPITANLSALSQGLQTGTIDFTFDNGTASTVQAEVIATSVTSGAGGTPAPTTSSACVGQKPEYLAPVFLQPMSRSVLYATEPQTVRLRIVDDCGNPLTAGNGGAALVSFGDQDSAVDLHDVGGGLWEGTWTPVNTAPLVTLQAAAVELSSGLDSIADGIAVSVQPAPVNSPAQVLGVVNAASGPQAAPRIVTPGSYVAIYGTNLASGGGPAATTIPLPSTLNGTQLFLAGQPVPLIYADSGQINALIPQNLNPNTSYQLVVQRGATMSVPMPLTIAEYQPGIYTLDLSGAGQGVVEIAGTPLLAAPDGNGSRPVKAGSEFLAIFATGLGPVIGPNGETPPADGAAAPLTTVFQTSAVVTASIGGIDSPVLFSGLTPSLVALYQVNVQVPRAVPSGDAVPLTLTLTDPVTGQSARSNTVTIAVQ
jgi:uncharacterized protein (TIGR03437 family)